MAKQDFSFRNFDGRRFKLRRGTRTKTNAKKVAESWRRKGFNARIVKLKHSDNYLIYTRKKGR